MLIDTSLRHRQRKEELEQLRDLHAKRWDCHLARWTVHP